MRVKTEEKQSNHCMVMPRACSSSLLSMYLRVGTQRDGNGHVCKVRKSKALQVMLRACSTSLLSMYYLHRV